MGEYFMNEAAFDLPSGFVDRTITYLENQMEDGTGIVLVIEREPLPEGLSLREAAAKHVAESRVRLRGYSVMFEQANEVASVPVVEIGSRWRDDDGFIYRRQTHLVVGSTWLIVAGESPLELREACDQVVDQVVQTLRIRE